MNVSIRKKVKIVFYCLSRKNNIIFLVNTKKELFVPSLRICYFFILLLHITTFAHIEDDENIKQLEIGNFALPGSQRMGPLLGFGQNIVDKGIVFGILEGDFTLGKKHKNFSTIIPYVIYGIRDDLSLTVEFPVAAQYKENGHSSAGISDIFAQLEYAFYHKSKERSAAYATLVGALWFPTGSVKKDPHTGFGSPSFFLGITASRMATDWYCYTSYGAFLTTKHGNHNKIGNHFYYQAGVGKNITYATGKWLFSWLLEMNGIYEQKGKAHGIIDNNSGGNTIYLGPTLWFSTQNLVVEAGVAPVVYQHHNGEQSKTSMFISFALGWNFT